jgi:hypothetical protein
MFSKGKTILTPHYGATRYCAGEGKAIGTILNKGQNFRGPTAPGRPLFGSTYFFLNQ